MKVSQQELKESPRGIKDQNFVHRSAALMEGTSSISAKGHHGVPTPVPTPVPPASLGTAGPDTASPSLAQTGLPVNPSSLTPPGMAHVCRAVKII